MKTDPRKIVRSPWCWVPSAILLYCILFFGLTDYFDAFDKQWQARLTSNEQIQLEETWKGLGKILRDGAPWPTLVEFKGGKVGVVYTDRCHGSNALLIMVQGKTEFLFLGNLKEMFRVERIVYPGDPGHENGKQMFFQ